MVVQASPSAGNYLAQTARLPTWPMLPRTRSRS